MSRSETFKTPRSVRVIAVIFLVLSPLILYLLVSKIQFQIDRKESAQGVLINNRLVIDRKNGINYNNAHQVTICGMSYHINRINISNSSVCFLLDKTSESPESIVAFQFILSERQTIMDLLLP